MGFDIKQNELVPARRRIPIYALKDTDGKTPVTNLTISSGDVKITKSGGSPTNHLGTLTTIDSTTGLYYYEFFATEVDTLGPLGLIINKSAVRDIVWESQITDFTPVGELIQSQSDSTKRNVLVYLVSDTDGTTPVTGKVSGDMTIKVSKNGGTLATAAGTIAELSDGFYNYVATAAELDTEGFLILSIVAVTAGAFRSVARFSLVTAESGVGGPSGAALDKYLIPIIPEVQMRAMYAANPIVGPPKFVAIRPKPIVTASEPQRYEVLFYPVPDQAYTLDYRYNRVWLKLSTTNRYPVGGAYHGELILQSCLAVLEQRLKGTRGMQHELFLDLLGAAQQIDAKHKAVTRPSAWPVKTYDPNTGALITGKGDAPPGDNIESIRRDLGSYLGFPSNPAEWSYREEGIVDTTSQSGVDQFHMPPIIPELKSESHVWSFMLPIATLTTVADTEDYDAPSDFGGIDGDFTYQTPNEGYGSIPVVGEEQIRRLKQNNPIQTGRPQFACTFADIDSDLGYQQNVQVIRLYPKPDAVYILEYKYRILGNTFGGRGYTQSVALGVPIHRLTILASCLYIAEIQIKLIQNGPMKQLFYERLKASISYDSTLNKPDYLGYNADRSGLTVNARDFNRASTVTYNSVQY